ncbi:MAG: oligosaccharide flippase family protein [Candidatus Omnitrophota bacterium]|jgi:O-antigen/teichoic acid export membrane protein
MKQIFRIAMNFRLFKKRIIERLYFSALIRNSSIYLGSNLINSVIPFLLLPVLTRYLSPSDYAIVAMFQILSSLLFPVISLSVQGAVTIKYFDKDRIILPRYIGNCLFIICFNTLIMGFLFYCFGSFISGISLFPLTWLWSPLLFAFAQTLVMLVLTLWIVQSKAISHTLFQILMSFLNVMFTIFFVVALKKNWEGRIEAQLITTVIFAFLSLIYLCKKRLVDFTFNFGYIKNALRYGVPLIPHEIGGLLMMYIDRFLLMNMKGAADTGVYTVAFQIASIFGIMVHSFHKAYVPWLFEKIKTNDFLVKLKIVKLTYLYFVVVLIMAVAYSLIASWALKFIVGKNFTGAGIYIIWFTIGSAFIGMYYMVSTYLLFAEKTYVLGLATFFITVLNSILTFFLIKVNGVLGAAQSALITNLFYFALVWFLSSKFYKMPWSLKNKQKAFLQNAVRSVNE